MTSEYLRDILTSYYLHDLVARYDQPGKLYHNLNHITYCLEKLFKYHNVLSLEEVSRLGNEFIAQCVAIIFHDVCYDIMNPEGHKQRSAGYFQRSLETYPNHSFTEKISPLKGEIVSLILSTQHRREDPKTVVIDIDMMILAEDPEIYKNYAQAVRKENIAQHKNYDQLRVEFLRKVLLSARKGRIYKFYPQLHESVIRNAKWELSLIEGHD